jgi:DNA-binding HxlR family transcriptional regulator
MQYGQFCPVAKASEIVAERWTPLVIAELLAGSTRFSDIRRGVPLMSQTLLSTRLKELARVGIVERRSDNGHAHEWHLTEAGTALGPVIQQLGEWGSGKLEVIGPRELRERLRSWFLLSAIRVKNDVAAEVAGRRAKPRSVAMATT